MRPLDSTFSSNVSEKGAWRRTRRGPSRRRPGGGAIIRLRRSLLLHYVPPYSSVPPWQGRTAGRRHRTPHRGTERLRPPVDIARRRVVWPVVDVSAWRGSAGARPRRRRGRGRGRSRPRPRSAASAARRCGSSARSPAMSAGAQRWTSAHWKRAPARVRRWAMPTTLAAPSGHLTGAEAGEADEVGPRSGLERHRGARSRRGHRALPTRPARSRPPSGWPDRRRRPTRGRAEGSRGRSTSSHRGRAGPPLPHFAAGPPRRQPPRPPRGRPRRRAACCRARASAARPRTTTAHGRRPSGRSRWWKPWASPRWRRTSHLQSPGASDVVDGDLVQAGRGPARRRCPDRRARRPRPDRRRRRLR